MSLTFLFNVERKHRPQTDSLEGSKVSALLLSFRAVTEGHSFRASFQRFFSLPASLILRPSHGGSPREATSVRRKSVACLLACCNSSRVESRPNRSSMVVPVALLIDGSMKL